MVERGSLFPGFFSPYEVLQQIRKVAYELKLPSELASVHLVFHVPMLKKCIGYPVSILTFEGLGVDDNLSYEEVLVQILHRQIKKFRNKEVAFVKFLWRNYLVDDAKWEAESNMMSLKPYTFM